MTVATGETKKVLVGRRSETARTVLIYSDRRLPEREQIRADINMFIRIINIYVLRTNMYYTKYILDTLVKTHQHT